MSEQAKKTTLKVVSIIFIVFGAIALIGSVLALVGSIAAMAVHVGLGLVALLATLLASVSAVLELLAGIWGVQAKSMSKCRGVGMVILILTLVGIVLNLILSSFAWTSLIGLILAGLYVYCTR